MQQIADWERAVASLNGGDRTEVIIPGSNATLLSVELATLIAGRCVTLQVFPLTLAEFGELYGARVPAWRSTTPSYSGSTCESPVCPDCSTSTRATSWSTR